jgi:hypothetical protein
MSSDNTIPVALHDHHWSLLQEYDIKAPEPMSLTMERTRRVGGVLIQVCTICGFRHMSKWEI